MNDKKEQMVRQIRERYGFDSPRVLSVMLRVSREKFAPKKYKNIAYEDRPVPIGSGQTMSQPYTVAFMTDLLIGKSESLEKGKVLEVGTGSGYQAAILSKFFKKVYTIEIVPKLAKRAKKTLDNLGFSNVFVKKGSGEWGWKEKSPFDAIMITAGVKEIPEELFEQLKQNGILVAPVGRGNDKKMVRYKKNLQNLSECNKEEFGIFHFVPFIKEKN